VQYVHDVRSLWSLARRYWLDALVVLAAVEGMLEVALRQDSPQAPTSTLWFAMPATAAVVLPLLARRRFPFAAPASVWILSAAISFVDGRLVVFTTAMTVIGLAAAFLLGNLEPATPLSIGPAGERITLLHPPGHDFFRLLRSKLHWGRSGRAGSEEY